MLPKEKYTSENSRGVIHLTLLLVLTLILFFVFTLIPKKSTKNIQTSASVLSDEEDKDNSNSGPGSSSELEEGEDEDESEPTDIEDRDDDEDEDEDEIEELEFEDGDEAAEDEDEVEELVEGDTEQKIEIKVENGKAFIKIKTKNRAGKEIEEELEATSSANIASLKLKVKDGEIKLRVRTENGKVVLVEEDSKGLTSAITNLPITIDSENNVVSVHTSSGEVNITEFPSGVMQKLLTSENIDQLDSLELKVKTEEGKTKVVYHAKGEDNVKFLGIFNVEAQVETQVDATTGTQEIVNQPWYLKFLSFLFTK